MDLNWSLILLGFLGRVIVVSSHFTILLQNSGLLFPNVWLHFRFLCSFDCSSEGVSVVLEHQMPRHAKLPSLKLRLDLFRQDSPISCLPHFLNKK